MGRRTSGPSPLAPILEDGDGGSSTQLQQQPQQPQHQQQQDVQGTRHSVAKETEAGVAAAAKGGGKDGGGGAGAGGGGGGRLVPRRPTKVHEGLTGRRALVSLYTTFERWWVLDGGRQVADVWDGGAECEVWGGACGVLLHSTAERWWV